MWDQMKHTSVLLVLVRKMITLSFLCKNLIFIGLLHTVSTEK